MLIFFENTKRLKVLKKLLAFLSLMAPVTHQAHATSTISSAITGQGDVIFTTSGTIEVIGQIGTTGGASITAPASGAGNIFVSAGTTILNNSVLTTASPNTGCNTYPGDTIINGGNLELYAGQVPSSSVIWMGGTSSTSTTGSLTFAEDFTLSNTTNLESTAANGNIFSALPGVKGSVGGISTSNAVLITGSGGTISLASTCTLSGAVAVSTSATLQTNYSGALGSTALTLNGGILDLNGYDTSTLTSVALSANSNMKSTSGTNATCVATSYNLNNHILALAVNSNIRSMHGISTGSITTAGTCAITFGSGYTIDASITIDGNLTISAQ